MKPVIGIFPALHEGESFVQHAYVRAVERSGGMPVMLPLVEGEDIIAEFVGMCDAFIFAGGNDISPERYGQLPSDKLGKILPERDRIEFCAFESAYKSGKPIMGICRGSQLINAALGGTLYQDLPTQYESKLEHRGIDSHTTQCHEVNILEESPLYALSGKSRERVNSLHHQAIHLLAPGLVPMARADDGIIEASYMPSAGYLYLFQWHPEKLYDTSGLSRKIFDDFIAHAGKG